MRRREWLTQWWAMMAASLVPSAVYASERAGANDLKHEDLELPYGVNKSRRVRLLVDPAARPERLLILLHGRGEADSPTLALKAWSDLYGLKDSYARLRNPPLRAVEKHPAWDEARAQHIDTTLAARPFEGFVVVCPVTPNPAACGNPKTLYREYAEWIASELVPAVRQRVPTVTDRVGLDGCSMGGSVALEVYLQRPELFRSLGAVQAAIGTARADLLAERFKDAKRLRALPAVHLLTSSGDPYRQANERLSERLHAAGLTNRLEVIPGPHNQPWLRQMGTLAMLLWHDRQL